MTVLSRDHFVEIIQCAWSPFGKTHDIPLAAARPFFSPSARYLVCSQEVTLNPKLTRPREICGLTWFHICSERDTLHTHRYLAPRMNYL